MVRAFEHIHLVIAQGFEKKADGPNRNATWGKALCKIEKPINRY
jgi:hypothetical protein